MFKLNLSPEFFRERKLTLRESLSAALSEGALHSQWESFASQKGLLAAALIFGLIGGAVPATLWPKIRPASDVAATAPLDAKLKKIDADRAAELSALRTIGDANSALQARLDQLEKRLAQADATKLDMTTTGAIDATAKPASKRKIPKP